MIRFRSGGSADNNFDAIVLGFPDDNWVMRGGGGDDTLRGGNRADFLFGGRGNDILDGRDGSDVLYGDGGADILDGGNEDDALFGGADADVLAGGSGRDLLFGGSGPDTFVFRSLNESGNTFGTADVIADFEIGDIIAFAAGTTLGVGFVFRNFVDGNTIVTVEANDGDLEPEMMIVLQGIHDLTLANFDFLYV